MLNAGCFAVAYGYVAGYLLVFFQDVGIFDFSVADSCPAAVKTYALGEEYQGFTIVAYLLVESWGFFPGCDYVGVYSAEFSIGRKP